MPFIPFDYAGLPVRKNEAMTNLIENLVTGYKASQVPEETRTAQAKARADLLKQNLANEIEGRTGLKKAYADIANTESGTRSNIANAEGKEQDTAFDKIFKPSERQLGLKKDQTNIDYYNALIQKQQLENKNYSKYGEREKLAELLSKQQKLSEDQAKYNLPGHGLYTGTPQEYAELEDIKKNFGENSQFYINAKKAIDTKVAKDASIAEMRTTGQQYKLFNSMPSLDKQRVLAYGAGMGYSPNEVIQHFNKGDTLDDMAAEKGFKDLSEVNPIYTQNSANRGKAEFRQASEAELAAITKDNAPIIKKYGQIVFGMSPKQIFEQLSGKNAKEQGELLAAYAVQPEIAAGRINTFGGRVGIQGIRHMEEASHSKLASIESLISPDARTYMNEAISRKIKLGVDAFSKAIGEQGRYKGKSSNTTNGMPPPGAEIHHLDEYGNEIK